MNEETKYRFVTWEVGAEEPSEELFPNARAVWDHAMKQTPVGVTADFFKGHISGFEIVADGAAPLEVSCIYYIPYKMDLVPDWDIRDSVFAALAAERSGCTIRITAETIAAVPEPQAKPDMAPLPEPDTAVKQSKRMSSANR